MVVRPWCQLDFVVVTLAWIPILVPSFGNYSVIRSVRALRPLRALKRVPGMPVLVQWILSVMPKMGNVLGLCGFVFNDVGPSFTCLDPTGESIKSAIVESIYPLKQPPTEQGWIKLHVQCVEDDDLTLDDGDHITFSEVEGMGGLNTIREGGGAKDEF